MVSEQPTVCAILLTRDRPELAAKAVACFRSQTYENRILLIYDSSDVPNPGLVRSGKPMEWYFPTRKDGRTIGALRNDAAQLTSKSHIHILIHWDSDDHSSPQRITEQVALLQASGADVVGYNEMLFWRFGRTDKRSEAGWTHTTNVPGEAWLFQCAPQLTPALGTSLAYWRKSWERTKFADLPKAPGGMSEYRDFLRNNKVVAVSSLRHPDHDVDRFIEGMPRMVARIHGANFMPYNIEEQIERGSNALPNTGWRRVPEWDARVRGVLS